MKLELILGIVLSGIIILVALRVVHKRVPRRLKVAHFVRKWKELQVFCKQKETWGQALIHADRLLDEALKKRRFKGKSMGERLVDAQRKLSNNDGVWYAHNLCKKSIGDANLKLKEADVKQALVGIRQALKDLGAFEDGTTSDPK